MNFPQQTCLRQFWLSNQEKGKIYFFNLKIEEFFKMSFKKIIAQIAG